MGKYAARRMVEMIPAIVLLTLIIFVILRLLPGDPVTAMLGQEAGAIDPEQRAAIERRLGLDQPLPVQYFTWLGNLARGEWGRTQRTQRPIAQVVRERMAVTLQLATLSWLLAIGFGIPIGVVSALNRNSWLDVSITTGALAGVATPNFLLGMLLIVIFAVYLQWLPTSGFVSIFENPVAGLRHMVLPAVALATSLMASIIRQTRSGMLEVMNEDYIRTARAKGLSNATVITRHALKNALLPVVTVAGLQVGNLVSGTIIIEAIFALPGMGRLIVSSVLTADYQTVQVVVVILAFFTIVANLVADMTYVYLDPRIRLS